MSQSPESSAVPAAESEHGAQRSLVLTSVSAAVLFLLLRVLAVAEWDWHTAFAITHTVNFDDAVGIVMGTLMANEAVTGALLIWLLPISVIYAAWPPQGGRRTVSSMLLATTAAAAAAALISTAHLWWVLLGAGIVAALVIAARLFWDHGMVVRIVDALMRRVGVTALVAALALAAIVDTPWVPLERITVEDEAMTGYVLDSQPGFHKVLTERDHELLIVNDDDVTHREELVHD